jgi:DNA repair protein RadC
MRMERIGEGGRIADTAHAVRLLQPHLRDLPHEELRFVYLDAGLRLLDVAALSDGAVGRVELPLRTIIRDALLLDARALIVAHNHPGGSAVPSAADKAVTRRLAEVTRQLDIDLVDHLIFAGEEVASFRALGLL